MDKHNIVTLKDYGKALENCLSCSCGLCNKDCPAYNQLQIGSVSPRGIAQVALGVLKGEYNISDIPDEILYACSGCRACEWYCGENVFLTKKTRKNVVSGATTTEILRAMKVENGNIDPRIRDVLSNIMKFGNPYGGLPKVKDDWVNKMGIKDEEAETLLYVGSFVPYDEDARVAAEAVIDILKRAGVKFRMLGSQEMDSGSQAMMLGDEGIYEEMVEHNLEIFKKYKIKKIICFSPHDYDIFLNYYEGLENIEVKHYTQVLWELINSKIIKIGKKINKKITYHDSCYLGRRNNIYEEPREILKSIPGVELVELELSRGNSYCCGGGGPVLWMDLPNVKMDLARADQIKELDVDVVAVACPLCLQMLKGAMDSRGYDIEVRDIAELVKDSCCIYDFNGY
ncbi:MAG: hypothetical protein AVO38_00200 [delta proteobacterium ML8_D]|jgi:Fe-S oxidoreductase|nr:MAG: hypothetical protein AVO38_00200 [delta proteobacterium ML8_D]